MKVTLAYPYDGHQPDETVEVEDAVGLQLISDGHARHAAPEKSAPTTTTKRRARGRS